MATTNASLNHAIDSLRKKVRQTPWHAGAHFTAQEMQNLRFVLDEFSPEEKYWVEVWINADGTPHGGWHRTTSKPMTNEEAIVEKAEGERHGDTCRIVEAD